jgi:hypothetical protein
MTGKLNLICLWAAVALFLAACSTNPPIVSTLSFTSTPIAASTHLPTATLSHRPTITPASVIASKAPSKPSATPTPSFSVRPIELGENFAETALWSDDGKTIYYAFRPRYSSDEALNWAAYDVATSATHTISLPLKYDQRIWKWLNIEPPQSGWYPELQGFVSPSGERVVYGVSRGGCSPIATCDPNDPPRVEVWQGNVAARNKTKVGEIPHGGGIYEVIWFDNESKVALNLNWETTYSCIADLETGVITPVEQLGNIRILESIWSTGVSPDGKILTAINGAELWLINLPDGKAVKIDEPVNYAHWSKDGQTLYYETDGIIREFRAYTPTTGLTSTLISQDQYNGPIGSDFAVSPNGDKVVFRGGWLKLVELPK